MAFFADAISKKATPLDLMRELQSSRITASGKSVNSSNALQVSTVLACCRVIGNGIAQVPLKLMRESGNTRLPEKKHPLYEILAFKPNSWQTSFEYREMLGYHVVLCGDHFSFISRNYSGQIMELIPFTPKQVTIKRNDDYSLKYEVRADNGSTQIFPAESIWHVKGPSWNSWQALDAVTLARDAIGLAMATEEAQGRLHKNGARPSGVYSVEGTLNPEQYKALAAWVNENISGTANIGKALILDRAAKWQNTTMTGIDAQSLETRRYQVEEICRAFGVNPIMVGAESKNTTYASAEQMFLAHVVHTLSPWFQRIEQSIDAYLLTDKERASGLYSNFVEEGLLRGSMAETKDALLGYTNGGLMTANEARAKLDLNPDTDPASDKLRIPANIVGAIPAANTQGVKL